MKWIVPLMGFTESVSRRTGMERLWSELRVLASPKVTVLMPWEWHDDMRSLAAFINRNSPGSVPRIFVFAYSWGAGYAFPRLARECERLGLTIESACLCDPVYRSGWLPWWLPINPLSLTREPLIGIPSSVALVHWVRQQLTLPRGHDLFPEDPESTEIAPEIILQEAHSRIDSHPAWRAMVMAEAKAFSESNAPALREDSGW
jgi:hypothetical protein